MMLTPEQVNEFVAKAVMDSEIGLAVQESVKRVMADLRKSYDNPFDAVIKRHVIDAIDKELVTNYGDDIRQGVQKALKSYISEEIIEKIVTAATEKLRSRY
jgi:hypothetical protein